MPIHEYYCRENHTIYRFRAKTRDQGRLIPKCPDNPAFLLERLTPDEEEPRGGEKACHMPDPYEDGRTKPCEGEPPRRDPKLYDYE